MSNAHLGILKISMIDWCHTTGRKHESEWALLTNAILEEFNNKGNSLDMVVIERVSDYYYDDFLLNFRVDGFDCHFVQTTFSDPRCGAIGGTIFVTQNKDIKITGSIDLPSSRPQFDNGQPGKLATFEYAGCEFIIGCCPQNLGRDGDDPQPYLDIVDNFWGKRPIAGEPSILPVAVWDEYENRYDIHVWQLNIEDAMRDDEMINSYMHNHTAPVLTLVEGLGQGTGEINQTPIASVIKYRVNPMVMYTNSPSTFTVTHTAPLAPFPNVNDTSLQEYISINITNKGLKT